MRRRKFITFLGGAVAAWPFAVGAQPAGRPVIGLVGATTASGWAAQTAAFRQGLAEGGFVEGRDVVVEARWADGQYDRLPGIATELAQRGVAVIVAFTTPAARAAKAATSTIPIVFTTISDPVQIGLVAALSRPGGNVTGVTLLSVDVGPKLVELMHEMIPQAAVLALVVNSTNPNASSLAKNLQAAAGTVGLQLHVLNAGSVADFDAVFEKLRKLRADGLIIARDARLSTEIEPLAALTIRYAVPAIYQGREFAVAGGLMSYASSEADSYRQVGIYTGRILKGDKPADLPVVQTTKVELIINLKTAKRLGLSVPLPLLGRADEVIE